MKLMGKLKLVAFFVLLSCIDLAQCGRPVVTCSIADISCDGRALLLEFARVNVPKFLYVSNNSASGTVVGFTINPGTGSLTPMSQTFSGVGTNPLGIAIDINGQLMYVGSGTPLLTSLSINYSTGALTVINSTGLNLVAPSAVVVDPTGRYVFASQNAGGTLVAAFNSTAGTLTANSTGTTASQPRRLAMDPLGRFLHYGSAANVTGTLPIGTNGVLGTQLTETPATGTGREELVTDATGSFLYTIDNNNPGTGLRISSVNQTTGQLTVQGTVSTVNQMQSIVMAKAGRYLYTSGSAQATINQYSLIAGANVVPLSPSTITMSANVIRLATEPSGRFVYAALSGGVIAVLSIGSSGTLTQVSSVSCSCTPDTIAVYSPLDPFPNPSW